MLRDTSEGATKGTGHRSQVHIPGLALGGGALPGFITQSGAGTVNTRPCLQWSCMVNGVVGFGHVNGDLPGAARTQPLAIGGVEFARNQVGVRPCPTMQIFTIRNFGVSTLWLLHIRVKVSGK